jgi:hypothetical protein
VKINKCIVRKEQTMNTTLTLWWLSNADVAELQAQPSPEQVTDIEEQDEEPEPEEYRRYA